MSGVHVRIDLDRADDNVLHVRGRDADGTEVLHLADGDPLAMIRQAVAAVDPMLGLKLGADPRAIIERLTQPAETPAPDPDPVPDPVPDPEPQPDPQPDPTPDPDPEITPPQPEPDA